MARRLQRLALEIHHDGEGEGSVFTGGVWLYDSSASRFVQVYECVKEVDEDLTGLDESNTRTFVSKACALYIHKYSMLTVTKGLTGFLVSDWQDGDERESL